MANNTLPTQPETQSEWGIELLDLDAYLARIAYDGPLEPTAETLRRMHRAHLEAVSFETVGLPLGRGIPLDLDSLQEKIVRSRYGGCCFENNLLFAAALERLGFTVQRILSRVRRGNPQIRYRSHSTLRVEADGQHWLADVGFGDEGPLEPLRFADGATLTLGDWTWRLDQEGQDWLLRCLHADGWFDVYSLQLEEHHLVDFEIGMFYAVRRPPFVRTLVAQRGTEKERYYLRNNELTIQHADGNHEQLQLSGDDVVRTLRETFNIPLTPEDALELREVFR
jgi:N-hydroxyarylamine O-acetyltransferase